MRKFLLYLLLLAVAASAASCRKAVEKAQRNIRFEGIEKIERQGLTGAEIVVRVMNNTGYKLQLETAEIDVYYADGRVGTVVLREPVEVPRRTTDAVAGENLRSAGALRAAPESRGGRPFAGRHRLCPGGARRPGARKNFARQDAVVGFFEYLWPDVAGR